MILKKKLLLLICFVNQDTYSKENPHKETIVKIGGTFISIFISIYVGFNIYKNFSNKKKEILEKEFLEDFYKVFKSHNLEYEKYISTTIPNHYYDK
jgi:hypothetical protein